MRKLGYAASLMVLVTALSQTGVPAADYSQVEEDIRAVVELLAKSLIKPPDDARIGKAPLWTIEEIGPVTPAMVPGLKRALEDKDFAVQGRAATALTLIGPEARDALPQLRKLLAGKNSARRAAAAGAVWAITGTSDESLPILTNLLLGKVKAIHISAAIALAAVGPPAKVAAPSLVRSLQRDDFPAVRMYAAKALARIDARAPEVLTALDQARNDRDPGVREAAGQALTELRVEVQQPTPAPAAAQQPAPPAELPPPTVQSTSPVGGAPSSARDRTVFAGGLPAETATSRGAEGGINASLDLDLGQTGEESMTVEGAIIVDATEKSAYCPEPLKHIVKGFLRGSGRKSGEKWHIEAKGLYDATVSGGKVRYAYRQKMDVILVLDPDGSAEGTFDGLIPWRKLVFRKAK